MNFLILNSSFGIRNSYVRNTPAAGVRGLAESLTRVEDVARAEMRDAAVPEWFSAEARKMLMERMEARREVCRKILLEGLLPARGEKVPRSGG